MPEAVASDHALPRNIRFGPQGRFVLQAGERRLLVDGRAAALGARAIDLLIELASRPDRLVSKADLLERVWPGVVVEEGNLHVQMSSLRKVLGGDVIATVPGHGYRFAAPLFNAAPDAVAHAATATSSLPLATGPSLPPRSRQHLFGRDANLAELQAALATPGCVTLAGPAGVGKTSLARAAASRWAGRSAWVDLAPLSDQAHGGTPVASALSRALGLSLAEGDVLPQLLPRLAETGLLVVLDNAEHLVQHTAELVELLLRSVPTLHLLVTSQLPLAVAGEQVQRLQPLPVVDATGPLGDGAAALLADRIAAADHLFRIDAATLPLLHDIGRQLDGLPLALEMAAARVPLLGLKGVRDALAQRFALLTAGHRTADARHRSLHHALDWSFRLLPAAEQRLFRALSVFAGGFTLDLAVALVDDPAGRWEVIERLAVLVDRSLVTASHDDPPRYSLLETMRAYAREQLAAEGEGFALHERHALTLLDLFECHVKLGHTPPPLCLAEVDNAREAIAWAAANERIDIAAPLAALVHRIVTFTPWRRDAVRWLQALESQVESAAGQVLAPRTRALWWAEFGRAMVQAIHPRATEATEVAVALWRPLGDPVALVSALVGRVRGAPECDPALEPYVAEMQALSEAHPELPPLTRLMVQGALAAAANTRGDYPSMLKARRSELALAREVGSPALCDAIETNVIVALNHTGAWAEAEGLARAMVQRLEGRSRDYNLVWARFGLLSALMGQGRIDDAQALLPQSLADDHFELVLGWEIAVRIATAQRRPRAAALLAGYLRRAYEQASLRLSGENQASLDLAEALAREVLGGALAEQLVGQGRLMDAAHATELAMARQVPEQG